MSENLCGCGLTHEAHQFITDHSFSASQTPDTGKGVAKKFRKKPVVIEAMQWTGDNLREIIGFTGIHKSAAKWTWDEYENEVQCSGLKIFTLEGPLKATLGDWIIKGVQGEFYPCKPDIFEATYDRV